MTVQNPIASVNVLSSFDTHVSVEAGKGKKTFPVLVDMADDVVVEVVDIFGAPVNTLDASNFNVYVLQDANTTLSDVTSSASTTFSTQWSSLTFRARLSLLVQLLMQGGRRLSVVANPYVKATAIVNSVRSGTYLFLCCRLTNVSDDDLDSHFCIF